MKEIAVFLAVLLGVMALLYWALFGAHNNGTPNNNRKEDQ